MKEVYTKYVTLRIAMLERYLEELAKTNEDAYTSNFRHEVISHAKQYMMEGNFEKAGDKVYQMGDCYMLWALQKDILKEKYDITWYTPKECHPNIIFD